LKPLVGALIDCEATEDHVTYLTEDQLLRSSATQPRAAASRMSNSAASGRVLTIFLSHSHKDRALVTGLLSLLRPDDVEVYVDWNDKDLPRVTNRATAEQIKKEISSRQLFIILATRNAMESKWVPWEIGIADQSKTEPQILVVPVADRTGRFYGNEYLQLYRHIELASDGKYGVFQPGMVNGSYLLEYLKERSYRR
jgi:TIR domain-containing protein